MLVAWYTYACMSTQAPPQPTFAAALLTMAEEGSQTYGPIAFQSYLRDHGLSPKRTWSAISVDRLDALSPELKQAQTMVFRLGSDGRDHHTRFALARVHNGWSDFFLIDADIFRNTQPEIFLPSVAARDLYVFDLLPRLTESSLVNLAIASGLLSCALRLDEQSLSIPATGQSTFSFDFRALDHLDTTWSHSNGQVEVDSLFLGRRNGKETLFLVEAKSSGSLSSLAKHKLVYPLLGVRGGIPEYMPVVPVYLRAVRDGCDMQFYVAECSIPIANARPPALSSLEVVRSTCLVLPTRRPSS